MLSGMRLMQGPGASRNFLEEKRANASLFGSHNFFSFSKSNNGNDGVGRQAGYCERGAGRKGSGQHGNNTCTGFFCQET